jgi:hypothetical protein
MSVSEFSPLESGQTAAITGEHSVFAPQASTSSTGEFAATASASLTRTQPAVQKVAPQWAADPYGRYEYRFWNGRAWTSSVSTAGVQSTDPPTH